MNKDKDLGETGSQGPGKRGGQIQEDLSLEELAILKSKIEEAGYSVGQLGNQGNFEITSTKFPIATHVHACPYYLELATCLVARPKGLFSGGQRRLHRFLNDLNMRSGLAKFTCDSKKPDNRFEGWMILASVKLVTGRIGEHYDAESLGNLLNLWVHDVAEVIAYPLDFGVCGAVERR